MLTFERVEFNPAEWARVLPRFADHTVCQSPAWLAFLEETQKGEIVVAVLRDDDAVMGYFAGLLIRRCGLRILGSPFPGWASSYMGFLLEPGVSRQEAVEALRRFAFRDLKCLHLEFMDRYIDPDSIGDRYSFTKYTGFEADLSLDEDGMLKKMNTMCRRNIRYAARSGLVVQEAQDAGFIDEYYGQLTDVFAKQRLVPTYGKCRVAALIRHLQPTGNLLLLRAVDAHGRCIGTAISVGMNGRAELWGTASWREYQNERPNESLYWQMFLYWKQRGMKVFDMGGAGDYKRKYGVDEISVPWIRISRYPVLPMLRTSGALLVTARQKLRGAWGQDARATFE